MMILKVKLGTFLGADIYAEIPDSVNVKYHLDAVKTQFNDVFSKIGYGYAPAIKKPMRKLEASDLEDFHRCRTCGNHHNGTCPVKLPGCPLHKDEGNG